MHIDKPSLKNLGQRTQDSGLSLSAVVQFTLNFITYPVTDAYQEVLLDSDYVQMAISMPGVTIFNSL